jgi:hypothetical protein
MTKTLQIVDSPLHWDRGPAFASANDLGNPGAQALPAVSAQSTDPSTAWVRSYLWSWISPEVAAVDEGSALTWSDVPLPVPSIDAGGVAVKVYARQANLITDDGIEVRVPQDTTSWIRLPKGTASMRRLGPGLIVVERFAHAPPRVARDLTPYQTPARPLHFDAASLTASGKTREHDFWVVLKQRYSPLWMAAADSGTVVTHIVAGGYANGWRFRCPDGCSFRIWYRPRGTANVLLYASLLVWLLLAIFCAISAKTPRSSRSLCR